MTDQSVRVRFVPAVDVGGHKHPPSTYETDVSPDEAKTLVEAGRAEIVGEPLKLTDAESAALPQLEPADERAEMVHGVQDQPVELQASDPEHGVL